MSKGIFSQTFCVLTSREMSIQEVENALSGFQILGFPEASGEWQFLAPSLVLAYRPEVNGKVAVDVVDRRWPDSMGDTRTDPTTFSAWTMGNFGPFTFPDGLLRAGQHSWNWEPGRTIVHSHTGFIRVRSSYVFGGDPKAPIRPKDYEPLPELEFLTRIVQALLKIPGTLCYFNPGGEVLRDGDSLAEMLQACAEAATPPLSAWCNIRFFKLNDAWFGMDTVGNGQLDLPDLEVVFPIAEYEPGRMDTYLRDVSLYLLSKGGEVLKGGDKIDGPGETHLSWHVARSDKPIVNPPRSVIQLVPTKHQSEIAQLRGK